MNKEKEKAKILLANLHNLRFHPEDARFTKNFTPPTEPYPVFGKKSMRLDGYISEFRYTRYDWPVQDVRRRSFLKDWLRNVYLKLYFFVCDVARKIDRRG